MVKRKKDPKDLEIKQVKFRLTISEYEKLKSMADDVGMSLPKFSKSVILGLKPRVPKISKVEARNIALELRRIGSNLNQVSKHLNIDSGAFSLTLGAYMDVLRGELREIWQSLN